ncbi:GNAT family N-acetyltransferase [Nonomuraea sp. SYSU D8015]|uniref:GNAT family N-acetyltransferase n=1 Tax=Nonomuraea sp. SYSU D8015 TaxID=2593644 RepID=UPI001660B909|nr:GNAT family N-acetyltransferase [Nonomuraea sp. SYSU D8015]
MSIRITPLIDPQLMSSSRRLAWLATLPAGVPVGSAFLRLFIRAGQDHLAELDLQVHPAEQRGGVGSLLLTTALAAAREEDRRCVIAQVEPGSSGEAFLSARGFRKVLTLTYARLPLAQANLAALREIVHSPHPGYRLVAWNGVVPDELAETFAASRHALDDMPMDDTDYGTVSWDVQRVRDAAQAIENRGDVLHTVAAIAESDDSIAGFTELVVPGDGKGDAQHYATGVLPEHRGHGLARWMKAEAIRQARERYPDLDGLLTDTADSNRHMRVINDALGYLPTHQRVTLQLDL